MTRFSWIRSLALGVLLVAPGAPQAAPRPPSQPAVDMPELAPLGPWSVGVRQLTVAADQPLNWGRDGSVKAMPRRLDVRVWYPAVASPRASAAAYRHEMSKITGGSVAITTPGLAYDGAPPVTGHRFPLVVVSHGFGGWDTAMTYLTENLASKGYVVVAIDHKDPEFHDGPAFLNALANVAAARAADQRAVLSYFLGGGGAAAGLGGILDLDHVGLIGYSMGGFGALATAGAAYDPASATLRKLPAAMSAAMAEGDPKTASHIRALVAIAPWGAQPSERAWSEQGLAGLHAPTLLIDGDKDEVVDFAQGPRWVFDHLANADRYLLVFQGAGHGVGGNPPPKEAENDPELADYFAEPVWRSDRLNGISQHFITAFLDLELKGDASKRAYLDVPTPIAAQGDWPLKFGDLSAPRFAGADQPHFWRGFQRGLARGLELHRAAAKPSGLGAP